MSIQDAPERFWAKVEQTDRCWLWRSVTQATGHGRFRFAGQYIGAHRYSYILAHGAIPEGHEIHHTCVNPTCVRPDHLVALTRPEHKRIEPVYTTHCPNGHEYTRANTGQHTDGSRKCRTCFNARARRAYHTSKLRRLGRDERPA